MPLALVPAFLTFVFIAAFTPGPNNILACTSSGRYGLRKSSGVLAGIGLGFLCVMLLCGAVTVTIRALSENAVTAMRYVGCAYIVWLAWKIATAPPPSQDGGKAGVAFMNGFILQFVNIKIIIYGITAFTGFLLPYSSSLLAVILFGLALTLVGFAGTISWAIAGTVFQKFFTDHARVANAVMGTLLLGCAVSMFL